MKKILFILGFIFLFTDCQINSSNEPLFKVYISSVKRLNPLILENSNGIFFSAVIDLFNNSDSILHYTTMSCSWQQNWLINETNLYLYNVGCDSNYPFSS